jgi:hypothetical protein
MLTNHVLEEINRVWESQDEEWNTCFLTEVVVCRELGDMLKKENFNFEFNPNEYNGYGVGSDKYYNIPIYIDDIDNLIGFTFE